MSCFPLLLLTQQFDCISYFQVPLQRTMTLKQAAERIQIHANVRDIQDLQFTIINKAGEKGDARAKVRMHDKSPAFDVLKGEHRDIRLMDLRKHFEKAPGHGEKGNFWELLDLDMPENYYSVEFVLKKT